MLYAIIGCLIIIGFLGYKLFQKQKIDKSELERYNAEIANAKAIIEYKKHEIDAQFAQLQDLIIQCSDAKNERICEETHTQSLKEAADEALAHYHDIVDIKMKELDTSIEEQRQKRQIELDNALQEKKQYYEKLLQDTIDQCTIQDETIKAASEAKWQEAMEQITKYNNSIAEAKEKFESIEHTLRQYDLEQQQKLFYTIQLPEEYQEDIEFLLTTVAAKVQHPDIISKLVWQEYVKPNLENTFKRIEIKPEPGIYKLTSLLNGKCYIGKSTNVKNRITDHFKSVVGITSIADQAVHHAIRKEGFWNWTIEIITYCEKEQLSDLEKYYIEFFKGQEYGYNKNGGG